MENPDARVELIHAMFPREARDPRSPASRDFPFASLFIERDTATMLEESGYLEMPYMASTSENM